MPIFRFGTGQQPPLPGQPKPPPTHLFPARDFPSPAYTHYDIFRDGVRVSGVSSTVGLDPSTTLDFWCEGHTIPRDQRRLYTIAPRVPQ